MMLNATFSFFSVLFALFFLLEKTTISHAFSAVRPAFAGHACKYLSDLPTPSIVVDVPALTDGILFDDGGAFSIRIRSGLTLYPVSSDSGVDYVDPVVDLPVPPPSADGADVPGACVYIHTSVLRSRSDIEALRDDPDLFLAEVDCGTPLLRDFSFDDATGSPRPLAYLCLGLNNHHVGPYYWARSAGSGSAMEAPGIVFGDGNYYGDDHPDGKGTLTWKRIGGNTNDGKRSEWAQFLKRKDTLQIIPYDPSDVVERFVRKFDFMGEQKCVRVYGVSRSGLPLGAEPRVVCEWRCG